MKITVMGAGAVGSAVVYDLLQRMDVTQVQVCDIRPTALHELKQRFSSPKLRTFQVDARKTHVLEPIVKGSECVISCVDARLNPLLARLALHVGSHFCDLGGNEEIVQEELNLHEEAAEKGLWIVPNCGLAPGLVNILCVHAIEQFEHVQDAHIRVGSLPLELNPPFNFRLAFSAEKLIEDYTSPVQIIHEGNVHTVDPLTGLETIHFPAPFHQLEAFYTAGGLSTLPYDLEGRIEHLDYKTIRYPGHAHQMQFVIALGLAEKRHIDVRTHLTYRDVLVRKMKQKLGGEFEDAVLVRLLINGYREGREQALVYEIIDYYDRETGIAAVKRCTGFPAAIVSYIIASQYVTGGGAAPPEKIVPRDLFFELLRERDLHIEVSWREGHQDIRQMLPGKS